MLSDVLDRLGVGGVAEGLRPVAGGMRVAGSAFTVKEEVGAKGSYTLEEFDVGGVVDEAERGDVLVFSMGGARVSTWGGLASVAARVKGVGGVVVDGGVRDVEEIKRLRFPVFARHITPVSGKTRVKVVSVREPVVCGGVLVRCGDVVVGDETGLVFIPSDMVDKVLEAARELEGKERVIRRGLRRGLSLKDAARSYKHV